MYKGSSDLYGIYRIPIPAQASRHCGASCEHHLAPHRLWQTQSCLDRVIRERMHMVSLRHGLFFRVAASMTTLQQTCNSVAVTSAVLHHLLSVFPMPVQQPYGTSCGAVNLLAIASTTLFNVDPRSQDPLPSNMDYM